MFMIARHFLFVLISREIEKEKALLHFISIVVKYISIIVILSLNLINSCFHLILVIIFIFGVRKSKMIQVNRLQHLPSIPTVLCSIAHDYQSRTLCYWVLRFLLLCRTALIVSVQPRSRWHCFDDKKKEKRIQTTKKNDGLI